MVCRGAVLGLEGFRIRALGDHRIYVGPIVKCTQLYGYRIEGPTWVIKGKAWHEPTGTWMPKGGLVSTPIVGGLWGLVQALYGDSKWTYGVHTASNHKRLIEGSDCLLRGICIGGTQQLAAGAVYQQKGRHDGMKTRRIWHRLVYAAYRDCVWACLFVSPITAKSVAAAILDHSVIARIVEKVTPQVLRPHPCPREDWVFGTLWCCGVPDCHDDAPKGRGSLESPSQKAIEGADNSLFGLLKFQRKNKL